MGCFSYGETVTCNLQFTPSSWKFCCIPPIWRLNQISPLRYSASAQYTNRKQKEITMKRFKLIIYGVTHGEIKFFFEERRDDAFCARVNHLKSKLAHRPAPKTDLSPPPFPTAFLPSYLLALFRFVSDIRHLGVSIFTCSQIVHFRLCLRKRRFGECIVVSENDTIN